MPRTDQIQKATDQTVNEKPGKTIDPDVLNPPSIIGQPMREATIEELIEQARSKAADYETLQQRATDVLEARAKAETEAVAAWDAIYDRLVDLKSEYWRTPGFDRSKLKTLMIKVEI